MSELLALDIAILPPREVSERAVRLSAELPGEQFKGLRLDADHLPHITLTQQFVAVAMLDEVLSTVAQALRDVRPMSVHVRGGERGGSSVWMSIARTPPIVELHERLMDALHRYEQAGGGRTAFADADARAEDIAWVTGYRAQSSGRAYRPHITVGHASHPPHIEPFAFEATTVAACSLGRLCTCRLVLRRWEVTLPALSS